MSKNKIHSHGSGPAFNPEILLLIFSLVAVSTIFYWTYSGSEEDEGKTLTAVQTGEVSSALREDNEVSESAPEQELIEPSEKNVESTGWDEPIEAEVSKEEKAPLPEPSYSESDNVVQNAKKSSFQSYTPGSILPHRIHFGEKESVITGFSAKKIEQLAQIIQANPHMQVRLIGHADPAENKPTLAEKRAKAVFDALVAEGIESRRMIVTHEGHDRPAVTEEGHVKNRRVELEVVSN